MQDFPRPAPVLDMTPDGRFRDPAPVPGWPFWGKAAAIAAGIAFLAGAGAVTALLIWLLAALLPVLLVVGAVGALTLRFGGRFRR